MSFALTVLGSSAMYATVERAASGYLLEIDGKRIWMDAGAGTWRNLLGHVDYKEIDGIVLSHRHPDHTSDVFQAFHARHYGGMDPLPAIPLWAPAEAVGRILGFCREFEDSFHMNTIAAGETISIGDASVTFVEMAHPPETVGMRVAVDGTVLAYSSDTGDEADFETLAGGADLFLCEATFQESDELWEGHLSASQAGKIASAVGCKSILLTHLPPGRDHDRSLTEARAVANGIDVRLANDGLRVDLA